MNNRWKCQCRTTDNKAYRAVQSLYPRCLLKAEFLRSRCWQRLSSYFYGKEMTISIVSQLLIQFHLKSLQSVPSSNNQIMQMGNVSVEYLILLWKVLFFEMLVPLLGLRLCKTNEAFWYEMTCRVSGNAWFSYRIKILYDRYLLSELA